MLELFTQYIVALVNLTAEMAPYLLLGFFIAGVLHVYLPKQTLNKLFAKRNLKSVIYASLMGIPLPLCSCGVIPTGISLHREGASKGATVSFLISTPQTGVDSIMVTYSLLGLPFAIARPIIALITGVAGGYFVNRSEGENKPEIEFDQSTEAETPTLPKGNPLYRIWNYAFDEFLGDIADWLLIGLALAGLISVAIPVDFFESVYMGNELISMFIVLVVSIPFYVCATGSVPIAAVLLMKGLNPGAVLVFLMAGPATNMATMTVISKALGKRTLLIYIASLVIGSLLFGLGINHLFPKDFFVPDVSEPMHDHGSTWPWIERLSALFLALVLLKYYFIKMLGFFKKKQSARKKSNQELIIEVQGMTCENCASRVESSLLQLDHVNESSVDLASGKVVLKGNGMNETELRNSVESAGYVFNKVVEE
ncbi:MAG: SO_0444 family Cu/Zn efflux transporter [Vicingaceae bacterium]